MNARRHAASMPVYGVDVTVLAANQCLSFNIQYAYSRWIYFK